MGDFFISVSALADWLGGPNPPLLYDVRKPEAYAESGWQIPSAQWRDPARVDDWAREIPAGSMVIVYCVHGHEVSQSVGKALTESGIDAHALEGGFEAWAEARGVAVPTPAVRGECA